MGKEAGELKDEANRARSKSGMSDAA